MHIAAAKVFVRAYAAVLLLLGATLAAGGTLLIVIHGSWYYLLSGLLLTVCGVQLLTGSSSGARTYAFMMLSTVSWAVWESGFDLWALLPRVVPWALLGLGFLTPCVRAVALTDEPADARGSRTLRPVARYGAVSLFAGALGAVLHYSNHRRAEDPVYRAGVRPLDQLVSSGKWALVPAASVITVADAGDWPHVGNDNGASRFSRLTQIESRNLSGLHRAWVYHTGVPGLEVTPLKIGNLLYLCTATNDVIALDAQTGQERWRFSSGAQRSAAVLKACRGVAYYRIPERQGVCSERIFTNTIDARLIALDAHTGRTCEGFGSHGQVSLLTGMGDWRGRKLPGYYYVTSAPTIIAGKVVLGGWVADAQYWGEPSGVVRAFDATNGRFAWAFDMGRPERTSEPPPGEQYTPSTPNAWAPMAADDALGLVYVPTGNTSGSDYYGVLRRSFDEHYSSSVVALEAGTGRVRWSFQTVHHDLWDYDVAPQPVLTDLNGPAGVVRALVQATKTGELFVLDRVTGAAVFPVKESPAPAGGTVPGERLSVTQPVSVALPSVRGPDLEERDMWGLTPVDQMLCRIRFRQARYQGLYTPPGESAFIQYPGILGGVEWSSVSIDPERGVLVVNASRMASYATLIPREQANAQGRHPEGFGGQYGQRAQAGTPYAVSNPFFLSPLGVPCQSPPYGTLSAVDLQTGRLIWTRWLGTASGSGPLGVASRLPLPLGTPNLGGSLLTASGLIVNAAGQDAWLRIYDIERGRVLWQDRLPAVATATPMTYRVGDRGRQFIVVAAGNADPRLGATGDAIVAYALDENPAAGSATAEN